MHIFFLLTYHIYWYFNWSSPFICHTLKIKTKGFPSRFNKRNGVVINSHCKFSLKKQISSKIKIIKAQMLTIDHYHQMVMAVTKQFCVAGIFNTVLYACFLTMRLFIFFQTFKIYTCIYISKDGIESSRNISKAVGVYFRITGSTGTFAYTTISLYMHCSEDCPSGKKHLTCQPFQRRWIFPRFQMEEKMLGRDSDYENYSH